MKRTKYFPLLMSFFLLSIARVVTAQPYSIQAQTTSVYNPVTSGYDRWDSTWYYYSGGRTGAASRPDPELSITASIGDNNIHSDIAISYGTSPGTTTYNKTVNTYDAAGHVNTETRYTKDTAGNWQPSMLFTNTYTGDNLTFQLAKFWNGIAWQDFGRVTYIFNSHNDIDTVINEKNDITTGYTWQNAKRLLFTYDTAYNRTAVVIQNPYGVDWSNYGLNTFTYDTAGNMLHRTIWEWLPDSFGVPTWFEFERFHYAYNSNNDVVADTTYWLESTGAWSITNIDSNAYDAAHNLILCVTQLPDSLTGIPGIARKFDWTYNSYNQCTSMTSHTWDAGAGAWVLYSDPYYNQDDYVHKYYYGADANVPEDTATTQVHALNNAAIDARTFPNPASDFVKLDLAWQDAQPFKVCLYNIAGQLLGTWNENATKKYTKTVSVSNLPAGNYFFKIMCSDGSMVKPFVIMR